MERKFTELPDEVLALEQAIALLQERVNTLRAQFTHDERVFYEAVRARRQEEKG